MALHIEPEPNVPIETTSSLDDLVDKTAAAAETVGLLSEHGLKVDIDSRRTYYSICKRS